jgi:hypothetical protein
MRENMWGRLEALEEARKLRDAPLLIRHINFICADGSEVEATLAKGPDGFIRRRAIGEELDAFKARVDGECEAEYRIGKLREPVILLFLDEGPFDVPYD